jgi:hypothetical protein
MAQNNSLVTRTKYKKKPKNSEISTFQEKVQQTQVKAQKPTFDFIQNLENPEEFGKRLKPGRFRDGKFEVSREFDEMSMIGEERSEDSFVLDSVNSGSLNSTSRILEDCDEDLGKNRSSSKERPGSPQESLLEVTQVKRSRRYPNICVLTDLRSESKRNSCKSVHSDDSTPHLFVDYEERLKNLLLVAFHEM